MKKFELDIGSYDTRGGSGMRGEFAKVRQWLCLRHATRLRVADRMR